MINKYSDDKESRGWSSKCHEACFYIFSLIFFIPFFRCFKRPRAIRATRRKRRRDTCNRPVNRPIKITWHASYRRVARKIKNNARPFKRAPTIIDRYLLR